MTGPPLARYLLAAYVLLIAYASLHPLSGWRAHGASPFAYLLLPWPRWITGFDIAANVLAYVPYGVLAVWSAAAALGPRRALLAGILSGTLLSLVLEALQSHLPMRVASNVDLLTNALGAALGALIGVRTADRLGEMASLGRLQSTLQAGSETALGLTLLVLWLFAQLNPASLLFGTGDLRDLVSGPAGPAHGAELFVGVESVTSAANLVAVALLASTLTTPQAPVRRLVLALLAAALGVKALAFAILMRAENPFAWFTPGAQQGLAIGLAVALVALGAPRVLRLALAAVLLMAATVLVNLAPPNPYTAATLKVWAQGHFLNFNGLTQFVSGAWPFAALLYIVFLAGRRERR